MEPDVLTRFWSDLVSRPDGPMAIRFVIQPLVSTLLAVRDGIKDGRTGRDPYLMMIATDRKERGAALKEGLRATGKVMLMGVVLDIIYQIRVFGGFRYPIESLAIAFVLAFLPYLIVRGPVGRITRARLARKSNGAA
jgi:hypothetical protein